MNCQSMDQFLVFSFSFFYDRSRFVFRIFYSKNLFVFRNKNPAFSKTMIVA